MTGFRALLAITDVGSRVEYLHQRGRLTVANLDEIEQDETAVFQYRAVQRRETGQVAPKKAAPRQPAWHAWADWLVAKIAARPDIYLRELQAELKRERGEEVCLGTICAACQALKQSRKKRR